MRTITLSCVHCSHVMAIAENHLGLHVRCPHCQEVVPTAGIPVAQPPLRPLTEVEEERMFGVSESTAPAERTAEPVIPTAESDFAEDQIAPWQENSPGEGALFASDARDWRVAAEAHGPAAQPNPEGFSSRSPGRRSNGWLLGLVVIPLISYSILSTIVIVIQYQRLHRPPPDTGAVKPFSEKSTSRP
jgi:hypothetical protein